MANASTIAAILRVSLRQVKPCVAKCVLRSGGRVAGPTTHPSARLEPRSVRSSPPVAPPPRRAPTARKMRLDSGKGMSVIAHVTPLPPRTPPSNTRPKDAVLTPKHVSLASASVPLAWPYKTAPVVFAPLFA